MAGNDRTAELNELVSLLVEGTIVTMDPERRVIEGGSVAVAGDRIVEMQARTNCAGATRTLAGSADPGATSFPD